MTTLVDHTEQRAAALRTANRRRAERAQTKRWIGEPRDTAASRERCAEILLGDPLAHLATMPVLELLTACRWTDLARARSVLRAAAVSENRMVGQLTFRQQLAIASQLRHGCHDQGSLLEATRS